jgi:hypothetical protein
VAQRKSSFVKRSSYGHRAPSGESCFVFASGDFFFILYEEL